MAAACLKKVGMGTQKVGKSKWLLLIRLFGNRLVIWRYKKREAEFLRLQVHQFAKKMYLQIVERL